ERLEDVSICDLSAHQIRSGHRRDAGVHHVVRQCQYLPAPEGYRDEYSSDPALRLPAIRFRSNGGSRVDDLRSADNVGCFGHRSHLRFASSSLLGLARQGLRGMRLDWLRAFRAVMQTGTVTGAAAVMLRTQPQVSRMISSLEGSLELRL